MIKKAERGKPVKCELCPRACGADRDAGERGVCGMANEITIARAAPHMWEEPPISGTRGSGTIFFSGCSLGCVFCQNNIISHRAHGKAVTPERLEDIMLNLSGLGVHNINLVTPTHFSDKLIPILEKVRPKLNIPIVYNCGGYESIAALRSLDGLVDIYLPDFKYFSPALSEKYSVAPDYFEVASAALSEMYRQTGKNIFDSDGIMTCGMIVRHLILPGCRHDSIELLRKLATLLPIKDIKISIMRQFTPDFVSKENYPELSRRVTSFEYDSVLREAEALGFDGYFQTADSADAKYTPDFDLSEI